MNSFHDLQTSDKFEDKIIYDFFIRLLDQLFGKHDHISIDSECETEINQQLIKNQSKVISFYFKVPKRVFFTQKLVRQTLKHMIDFLNSEYKFQQSVQFYLKKVSTRIGDTVIGTCHTVFSLT